MKDGNWIPLHTQVRYWLPRDRSFTELEALICHTLDINESKTYSINGYAKQWGWSRNKVRLFLNNIRTPNGHHRETHYILGANSKGHLEDTQGTPRGQGITLKINNLQEPKDTQRTPKGHLKVHYYNNNINTNKKNKEIYCSFDAFYEAYPRKRSKPDAIKAWGKISPNEELLKAIMAGLEKWKRSEQWRRDGGKFIPYPASWLNDRGWEDEIGLPEQDSLLDDHNSSQKAIMDALKAEGRKY